ncbi:MAG: TonB-dependent receptor [Acidobacteriota bacterium]
MEFDIEAQPLASALRAFSDQSNLQVLYASELVADFDSPGVQGSYTAEEAITAILSSSPLGFVFNGDDTIAVTEGRGEGDGGVARPGSGGARGEDPSTSIDDAIVVTGTRYTIQSSIEEKRTSDLVVEALTTEEIGDIPALSIGEALETLTGIASHREQGGATEVSIRGLGPFLGATTINRREATNGSGDRSVNYSQFPSELFNTIKVYKTQQASLIEGGVSGQIELETARPLDRDDQSMLFELKGTYNPDNENIDIAERDIGFRGTFSYIDQYETKGGDKLGIALGFQRNLTTNPEAEARSSSTYRDCRNDPSVSAGVYSSGNCDSGAGDLVLEVDPETGVAPDANAPFIFVPSQRSYRQNITDDERDAFFAAFQWQPNDKIDVYLDTQYSDRTFTEIRNDLVFAEQRRVNPEGLISTPDGSVQAFENNGRIETNSTYQERLEEYTSFGLGLTYDHSDRLQLSFDAAYSDTSRRENILQTRLQSEPRDIFGNPTPAGTDRPDAQYTLAGGGADIFTVVLTDFDVTNADLFADNARTRIDLNQARDNTIRSLRGDFELQTDWGSVYRLDGGVRASQLEFQSFPRVRDQRTFSDSAIQAVSLACRNLTFPESDFLSGPSNGQNLITNVDGDGNVLAEGTGNTFASFDPLCLADMFIGEDWVFPEAGPSTANIDVEETTYAAYLQANYVGTFMGRQVRGNYGLRVVNTDVDSTGLRTTFTTSTNPDGTLSVSEDSDNFFSVVGGNSYTELLPSFSAAIDLTPETIFRFGVFRGLSRPDPADLGFGRSLSVDDGDDPNTIADLEGTASGASGNPDLEPLTSWNLDLAIEWYPNKDTILAVGTYYKRFLGGFENTQRVEEFSIDGQPFFVDVTTTRTDTDSSEIFGLEFTGSHSFSYLASPFWSGFGVKASYNYASSDFEFEDQNFGESLVLDEAGSVVSQRVGIVPPAEIFGLSEHVFSAQIYYETEKFDLATIYKFRSEYFQQFISSPGLIRYVGDTEVVEVKASYKLKDQLTLKVEGINLFDEPKKQYIPTNGNLSELNSYGPRYFVGLRYRL